MALASGHCSESSVSDDDEYYNQSGEEECVTNVIPTAGCSGTAVPAVNSNGNCTKRRSLDMNGEGKQSAAVSDTATVMTTSLSVTSSNNNEISNSRYYIRAIRYMCTPAVMVYTGARGALEALVIDTQEISLWLIRICLSQQTYTRFQDQVSF